MSTIQLRTTARIVNQAWRLDEATGFLRCTVAVLRVDVLRYLPDEMPGAPTVGGDGMVWIYVPAPELADPASIQSLEGMPAVVGHIWQDTGTVGASCGNVAGSPCYDAETLFADVIVTDPETVRRIMLPPGDPDKLEEISSAYDAAVEWVPGIDGNGNPYHGQFRHIRYNHLAILPQGMGRAGSSVRILNRKKPAMDFTQLRLRSTGKTIRVANEDVPAAEEADTKAANAADPADLQKLADELAELNKRKSEIEGQLQALQEQLNAALNPDNVEAAATALNEERDDADKVMNAHGLKLTEEQRKLRGHALRVEVVNSVRVKNNAAKLDDKADEPFVRGMFAVYRDSKPVAATVPPAGHQIVNAATQPGARDLNTNDGRRAAMYPNAK